MKHLQPSREELLPYFEKLWDQYRKYCLSVSPRGHTLSIETCGYLVWLCDTLDVRAVADFGSGFTSYVFRSYAAGSNITVVSVDDNPEWATRTARFLEGHSLPTTNIVTFDECLAMDIKFDLIVYDYSSGSIREMGMGPAVSLLSDVGVIVFDDAQHGSHYAHMVETSRNAGLHLLDIHYQTVDEANRFAALACR